VVAKITLTGRKPAVAHITGPSLVRNTDVECEKQAPTVAALRQRALHRAQELIDAASEPPRRSEDGEASVKAMEASLWNGVLGFGRALLALFLAAVHERIEEVTPGSMDCDGRQLRRGDLKPRNIDTRFGVVRYWRRYMRGASNDEGGGGFFPVDVAVGLSRDRFSMGVFSLAVRLATRMSFDEAHTTLGWFVPTPPSTEVIEQATLGFGRYTREWFESTPAPDGDGDVLVIMVDSKGIPTATEEELSKRRGKRKKSKQPKSPRHRGRQQRQARGKKPRRKKGDKSKNAKMATLVVMYTLRRHGSKLLGPINRWHYASLAPKKHAFAIARREADKRGFPVDSGKTVQVVTDGDPDLERYCRDYFPEARHTLDVIHAVEKLWEAGACLFREGSDDLRAWMAKQRQRLYGGKVGQTIAELRRRLDAIPKTGPGNKGKRERLGSAIDYLAKRLRMMNYDVLLDEDLEISSGPVEGAVKYIIGRRCDHGGMRWIKERAESILQLRCIDANGDWESFIDFVHDRMRAHARATGRHSRLQRNEPGTLPQLSEITQDAA
jgi:hypothetical protein